MNTNISKEKSEMLTHLRELIAIPSVTGTEEVKLALHKALEIAGALGMRTTNCSDILGYAEIGDGDELMGILCHLDVVPAGDGWTHPPFAGEIVEDRIYGRGVVDDKGPAIAALYAMKDVMASGKALNKRVRIIFGCQEEAGDWDDMQYYCSHEEIPSFGFTPDADFPAIYGEKGILMLSVSADAASSGFRQLSGGDAVNMVADWADAVLDDGTNLHTVGKAAHGSMPEDGENAITRLMEQAAAHGSRFAAFYMDKIGWDLNGELLGIGYEDASSGKLSLNVGKAALRDGQLQLQIDIRYPVTVAKEKILTQLRETLQLHGMSIEIISAKDPVYMDKNGEVISKLMAAYQEITGDMTQPRVIGGGTYARAMKNIVAFGPVFPGREYTEHKKDEWISLDDLRKARAIYALAIEKLACD